MFFNVVRLICGGGRTYKIINVTKLQMGQNPITTEGAKAVVRAVQSAKDTSLIRVCLDVRTPKVTIS